MSEPVSCTASTADDRATSDGKAGVTFRLQLVVVNDSGHEHVQEVARIERDEVAMETLGLTRAEGKLILKRIQEGVVEELIQHALAQRRHCPNCDKVRHSKGHHDITIRTLPRCDRFLHKMMILATAVPTAERVPTAAIPAAAAVPTAATVPTAVRDIVRYASDSGRDRPAIILRGVADVDLRAVGAFTSDPCLRSAAECSPRHRDCSGGRAEWQPRVLQIVVSAECGNCDDREGDERLYSKDSAFSDLFL